MPMRPRRTLSTQDDISQLVTLFYDKLMSDDEIGYIFNEVVHLDLAEHLPLITSFWSSILLGIEGYKGNPMSIHFDLDRKSELTQAHFDRWLLLWKTSVDELFQGALAEDIKNRAEQIAGLMFFKIKQQR